MVVSLVLIVFSWSLFYWLSTRFVLAWLFPYLLVISLLSWFFSRSCLRWIRIRVGRKEKRLYILLTLILTITAPIFAHAYALWLARDFVEKLGLEAELKNQNVQLVDQLDISMREFNILILEHPHRNVTSVYNLDEPLHEATDKLRNRLQHVYDWTFSEPAEANFFSAKCTTTGWGRGYEILLEENGSLKISLEFGYPDYCSLK